MEPTNFDAVIALVGGKLSINAEGIHYHDGQTPPSESAINAKLAELQAAHPLQELREKRNVLLASSDWTGLADTALTNEKLAEWKMYRQHLRNLPDGLDTETKVKEATWPVIPE
jgi:hypothetical protein